MIPFFSWRTSISAGAVSRTFHEIAQCFDSPFDSETRLRRAQKLLRRIVPYHQCALLEAAVGDSRLLIEPDSREQRETLSPILARLLSVLTDDAKRGANTGSQNAARLPPVVSSSYLAVPVVGLDRVLGVLYIRDGKPDAFTDEHLQILSVVASQIAAYLTACQLHKQEVQITSEHKAARAAAVAETRAKDEFLAMLGHELRSPVTAIRSVIQTIRDKTERNADIEHATNEAEQQVKHLTWLLDELLDVSRLTRGKIVLCKQTVTLQTIVAAALETVGGVMDARGHVVSVSLPEAPLCFEADLKRMTQVVGNLLDNAAKYTPQGGAISVRGYGERGEVVLRVRDSGIGIEREMLPRVFDLFVQRDPVLTRSEDRLGVGLTLARTLVELHHGSISAHSEGVGRGSEFVLRLPVISLESAARFPSLTQPANPSAVKPHRLFFA